MPAIKQSNYFSFDSSVAPMTYADQYIEITITVPTSKLYGLGEHTGPLLLKPEEGPKLSFWTRDQPPNVSSKNQGQRQSTEKWFFTRNNSLNVRMNQKNIVLFQNQALAAHV